MVDCEIGLVPCLLDCFRHAVGVSATITDLATLAGKTRYPYGLNNAGQVVGCNQTAAVDFDRTA